MHEPTIKLPDKPRILVARTDRIGDVVLSLPVFASLKRAFPGARVCALARSYTAGLLEHAPGVDQVIVFDAPGAHIPAGAFSDLLARVKAERFDVGVALYLNFSVGALLAFAGVPARIGPATKLAQVFLTHRIAQRRSKGTRHEADHNLDLLAPLGVAPVRMARLAIPAAHPKTFARTEGRPLVGIHPGHGESSRNWSEARYAELAATLTGAGCEVVITGSPAERELAHRIARASNVAPRVHIGADGLAPFAAALGELDAFVASSTGPLHLASAVGTPAVGIYCPIFVCLPERWGPIGPNDSAIRPDVDPCERCVGERCPHWDCMESIGVATVKRAVLDKIGTAARA